MHSFHSKLKLLECDQQDAHGQARDQLDVCQGEGPVPHQVGAAVSEEGLKAVELGEDPREGAFVRGLRLRKAAHVNTLACVEILGGC